MFIYIYTHRQVDKYTTKCIKHKHTPTPTLLSFSLSHTHTTTHTIAKCFVSADN